MKKKGLIISTIVMVVVLIASLTTATYAWFNASTAVSVHDVTVSVASASNISIGLAKDSSVSRSAATSYVNGTITYTETNTETDKAKGLGTFGGSGSKAGLGTSVDWDWVLSSIGGVSSSANGTAFDGTYTPANALYNCQAPVTVENNLVYNPGYKALFNGNRSQQGNNPADVPNTVIYAPFGLRVEKSGMNYLYCDITITPADEAFWGIVTSLKLEINNGTAHYYHPFAASSGDGLLTTAISYTDTPGLESVPEAVTFRFVIAKQLGADDPETPAVDESKLLYGATSTIYQFDIRMFLDGPNDNCVADATQYGASIHIEFNACATADYSTSGKVITDYTGA